MTWSDYLSGQPMTDAEKDDVCTRLGYMRAHSVTWEDDCISVINQHEEKIISTLLLSGDRTRQQWGKLLTEEGWCPFSVEIILDCMAAHHFFRAE